MSHQKSENKSSSDLAAELSIEIIRPISASTTGRGLQEADLLCLILILTPPVAYAYTMEINFIIINGDFVERCR